MFGFVLFIGIAGYFIGYVWFEDVTFVVPALVMSSFINIGAYFYSDKMALALSGARSVGVTEEPEYVHLVENLCIASGIPQPHLHIIETDAINAFATGRDPQHASIAVTRGLLQKLEKREIEAVLAHELSHIKNYDIRLMTVIVVLVGTIALLVDWFTRVRFWGGGERRNERGGALALFGFLVVIFAPIIGHIIKLAVSRQREYLADASAAYITRFPDALANALEKINSDHAVYNQANSAIAHLFISDPLKHIGKRVAGLFSTHPPIEERISRLRAM